MKLLESTEENINKNKKGENFSNLEITEVVLAHFNIFNDDYQRDSNKLFGQLIDTSPKDFIF